MKNKFLRVAAVFALIAVLAFSFCGCAGNKKNKEYPKPTEGAYANDFAEVLSQDVIDSINAQGAALDSATTAQAVVITVDSLDGETAADYALNIGREWGVGDKEKNNGIVVLLAEEDREIYVSVGYGLEGALPDSKTGRIIDTYTEYLSSGNYSAGLLGIYNTVVNEVYIEYGITPPEQEGVLPNVAIKSESEAGKIVISWIVLIVIVVLYVLIFGRRGGMFIFTSPRFFGGGFHSNGGFHSGGGSSGFGGFGGGSFGGGGAGRKF